MKKYKLYNGIIDLKFQENPYHKFWVKFNDEEKYRRIRISTTGATGIIDKSTPLMYWAVGLARDYLLERVDQGITRKHIDKASKQHKDYKKEAADIGTRIHEWVSDWILGKEPEMPKNDKVVNGITAFLKFQRDHKIEWVESERAVYYALYKNKRSGNVVSLSHYLDLADSTKRNYELYKEFAGFLDSFGIMDDLGYLIDFKSSKRVYPEYILQAAGYSMAYEEEMGDVIDRRMILKFGKNDGKFKAVEVPVEQYELDNEAFLSALKLKSRMNSLK